MKENQNRNETKVREEHEKQGQTQGDSTEVNKIIRDTRRNAIAAQRPTRKRTTNQKEHDRDRE